MKDPYLPGAICEVWDEFHIGEHHIKKFYEYNFDDQPTFRNTGEAFGVTYFNYRVLDTEWTLAPYWAVCSTVDKDGDLKFWIDKNALKYNEFGKWEHETYDRDQYIFGLMRCPDKTRYEGDAWKTSLRMRPEWAKVK